MILGIYTASQPYSLAIVAPDQTVHASLSRRASVETLTIAAICDLASITLQAITAVGVVTGPGGYTATRIGVTIANTIAQGLGVPLYGLSSLDVMAYATQGVSGVVLATKPTTRHYTAVQLYAVSQGETALPHIRCLSDITLLTTEQLANLRDTSPVRVIACSEAAVYACTIARWVAMQPMVPQAIYQPVRAYYAHDPV